MSFSKTLQQFCFILLQTQDYVWYHNYHKLPFLHTCIQSLSNALTRIPNVLIYRNTWRVQISSFSSCFVALVLLIDSTSNVMKILRQKYAFITSCDVELSKSILYGYHELFCLSFCLFSCLPIDFSIQEPFVISLAQTSHKFRVLTFYYDIATKIIF